MKVALCWINVNATPKMNLGVALLARELAEAGHEPCVLHLNEHVGLPDDPDAVLARLQEEGVGLICLAFGRNHVPHARRLLPTLRRGLPGVPVLCGGVHATLAPEQVLGWPEVDYVFVGEADGRLAPFVDRLARDESVRDLEGYGGQDADGTWQNAMPPPPSLADQTWIDFDHIDHLPCLRFNRGMFEVVSGRGCPGSCTFCFNQSMRRAYRDHLRPEHARSLQYCRKRGVENLLGEMEAVLERFADEVRLFSFADDAFNHDRDWTLAFCEAYAARIQRPYTANLLVQRVDDDVARALKASGAIAKIGVESGLEHIRCRLLGKAFSNAAVEQGLACLRTHGVPTRIYLMVGNPTETESDVLETFRFTAGLQADSARLCIFYPIEGTPIYERCRADGLLGDREYENYDDLSVLRWAPPMALFLEKVHDLHPWLHNRHLAGCAALYEPLVARALAMDAETWHRPETLRWVRDQSVALTRRLRARGVAHYFNPFPERPDVSFLFTDRAPPLPNADVIEELEGAP